MGFGYSTMPLYAVPYFGPHFGVVEDTISSDGAAVKLIFRCRPQKSFARSGSLRGIFFCCFWFCLFPTECPAVLWPFSPKYASQLRAHTNNSTMVSAVRRSARKPQKRSLETAQILDSDTSDFEDDEYESASEEPHRRARPNKRPRMSDPDPNFVENALYVALSNAEAAVSDLALEWVEQYMQDAESNLSGAITQLFNLVLRCCGCLHLAQEHDMINSESADATVADLSVFFGRQGYHEYPFISKNKELKFFRTNVVEFFENIVTISHEKGCLYKEEEGEDSSLASPMMSTLLAWLVALSGSTVRPFRFVATVLLFAIQSQICEHAVSLSISLEKQLRQLNNANNNKNKRNQKAQQKKIDIITETIESFKSQHDTLLEYLDDIFLSVFIHRYRDVDSTIRIECLRALGHLMMTYEAIYFQAKYLRYFGWLLSDPTDSVREETVIILQKLYRYTSNSNDTMGIGFRKFTDRFKRQFISMAWKEKHMGIKIHLFGIYNELLKLGFLDDSDTHAIGLFGFFLTELPPTTSERAKKEWSKFAENVSTSKSRADMEKFNMFLSTHVSDQFGDEDGKLKVSMVLQYKALADFLKASYSTYINSKRSVVSVSPEVPPLDVMVSDLFKLLYFTHHFQGSWNTLLRFILCDISSITFNPTSEDRNEYADVQESILKEKMDISKDTDKLITLSLLFGSISSILSRKSTKRQEGQDGSDDINSVLPSLALSLSELENFLSKSPDLYVVFMRLTNVLLAGPTSLGRSFTSIEKEAAYDGLHIAILAFFTNLDKPSKEMIAVYDEYFSLLLRNSEGSGENQSAQVVLTSTIKMKLEDLVISLTSEAIAALNEDDPLEDFVQDDDELNVPPDQKLLCNKLLNASITILKLCQLGKVMNINKFIAEPVLDFSNSFLEVLEIKFMSKVEFGSLIKFWPNNYLKILDQMESSWKSVLDLVILSLCWKLEDLVYASNDTTSSLINIDTYLDDYCHLLRDVSRIFVSVSDSLKELNEVTAESNASMRNLVQKLVVLENIFASDLADAIVSLRTFHRKLRGRNSFQNFDEVLSGDQKLGPLVNGPLSQRIQAAMVNVFLIKEAKLAKIREVTLERTDIDDVNYDDYFEINEVDSKGEESDDDNALYGGTAFDSSDIEDDENDRTVDPSIAEKAKETAARLKRIALKEQSVWEIEKDLCIYVVKLLSALKVGALNRLVLLRIKLNSKTLGGLFEKILGRHEEIGPNEMGDIVENDDEPLDTGVVGDDS